MAQRRLEILSRRKKKVEKLEWNRDALVKFYAEIVSEALDGLSAAVDSAPTGLRLILRWDAATLPRMHQWVHPAPGIAVLGLCVAVKLGFDTFGGSGAAG